MLEDFVKWMATLSELEREQKMEVLMNLFAPSPSHEDFKRLKAAYKRKERIIEKLKKDKANIVEPSFGKFYNAVLKLPCYKELRKRVVAAKLYKDVLNQNKMLRSRNKKLQADIENLIYKIHLSE